MFGGGGGGCRGGGFPHDHYGGVFYTLRDHRRLIRACIDLLRLVYARVAVYGLHGGRYAAVNGLSHSKRHLRAVHHLMWVPVHHLMRVTVHHLMRVTVHHLMRVPVHHLRDAPIHEDGPGGGYFDPTVDGLRGLLTQ
uniref:Uncharacterized protein n=1 Tax=Cacopsylla melanoneura TaxID=428564 RepID=A0A8D9C2I8_9HEMI